MDFVMSYSGGKDSALALHKLVQAGHRLVALVTTINTEQERSWFHGIPIELLQAVAKRLDVPLIVGECTPDNYNEAFEQALTEARQLGALACAFGDIDIEGHREWDQARASAADLECLMPLWQMPREAVVEELLHAGIKAVIKIVDLKWLDESLLGETLTPALIEQIKAAGADICGENGEYHTFVYDSPGFATPVPFRNNGIIDLGTHKAADIIYNA